jgi:DNA primase small subunit
VDPAERVIRQKFQEYYFSSKVRLTAPPRIPQREFGFLLFKEKFMVRHRSFRDLATLTQAIRDLIPAHVYFSTAYYEKPTLGMDEKGWKGADLVLDIDADHLATPCKSSHDSWKCKGCGKAAQGGAPKVCPKCKNDRIETQTWLCENCLRHAKEETLNVLDLFKDLGPEPKPDTPYIRVYFSGHRGYHLHISHEDFLTMGEEERREIVDYLLGQGLDPQVHGIDEKTTNGVSFVEGPRPDEPGWRGRIVTGIYDVLSEQSEELGLTSPQITALQALNRDVLLDQPLWSSVRGVSVGTWRTIALKAVERRSAKIDTVVTTDTHRLIRLPGTLNGHTGLLAMDVPLNHIDEFDPFSEALAFRGEMKIRVKDAPDFRLGDRRFGPFQGEKVDLPTSAAMLLLCKRRAEPAS